VKYVGGPGILIGAALFVTRAPSVQVFVYNTVSLHLQQTIIFPGLTYPSGAGLVADAINNFLYIRDYNNRNEQRQRSDVKFKRQYTGTVLYPRRKRSLGVPVSTPKWIARLTATVRERNMGNQSTWTSARYCRDINERHGDQELRINCWFRTLTNVQPIWHSYRYTWIDHGCG